MDLKRLNYFCKVVEYGSVTQAAKVLNISQPPLSKRIQELESDLNVELFERVGNRLKPTEAGRYLYHRACKILRQVEDIAEETVGIANAKKKIINIGVTHLYKRWFTPILFELYNKYPSVEVTVSVSDSIGIETQLQDGLVDVAFIQKPINETEYDYISFAPIKPVAIINNELMPKGIKECISFSMLAKLPLILLYRTREGGTSNLIINSFNKIGLSPKVVMHISQPTIILECLEMGMNAATILPSSEVCMDSVKYCKVINVFPEPQIYFPAMVKMRTKPYINELLEIIRLNYLKKY